MCPIEITAAAEEVLKIAPAIFAAVLMGGVDLNSFRPPKVPTTSVATMQASATEVVATTPAKPRPSH